MQDLLIRERDLAFLLHDHLGIARLADRPRFAGQGRETWDAVIETARRIAAEKFRPHNRASDLDEPRIENGKVVVHPDIGPAIAAFSEAGFAAAHHDEAMGGMQLPWVVTQAAFANFQAANLSTVAYPFLTIAAGNLIAAHGSESQKERFLTPLTDGRFFGTMMLSEPHAGSSLSDVRTLAKPLEDGTWTLTGTKMWISGGEHEMAENIVHLVLARTPEAPPGVKGLSLFLVPRYRLDADGNPGPENGVVLAGLNHKMGYRGTVNTVINLGEGAPCIGELIGERNRGLTYMFHMMNEARIGVGSGAVALAYTGYLHALDYARTRPQGRHPDGKDATSPQIPLIEHADIRRMLLLQKAVAEGGLALCLEAALLVDDQRTHPDEAARRDAGLLLDFLTPVIKSFLSDRALEANDAAIQIHGGAGYTRDFPVEQFWRDNRLNPIHEGANGIQAIDLLGRKLGQADGRSFALFREGIAGTVAAARAIEGLSGLAEKLETISERFANLAARLLSALSNDPRRTLANAAAFMDAAGYISLARAWLDQAVTAERLLASGEAESPEERAFLVGKLETCRFVFAWLLPRAGPLLALLEVGDDTVFRMRGESF
ncbi:acyl-CoA dehydrogenase [Nisaea sediminum]|uniref:acyl-CoA dehydrogenase n=1 Tax=Nisaea sediminum TaxID=2775867 RepID=UPI00186938F0|nr:acyl-CoA dehydrogenase [Nisaea sediminum]